MLNRLRIDSAVAAINLLSAREGLEMLSQAFANEPDGIIKPPKGSAEPLFFDPTNSGGKIEPKLIEVIGSTG